MHRALGLPSEIGDVLALFADGERALYYSVVPEIW
jgi:hypothetical protein